MQIHFLPLQENRKMDYQAILQRIFYETRPMFTQGKVADYIPALASIDPSRYGISVVSLDQSAYHIGDAHIPFSIQSISKVFSFTLAYKHRGDDIWNRIGKESSGTAFNSLIQLEYENGIPRNPFINAGAIVVADILLDIFPDPLQEMLRFVRQLAGDATIHYNPVVAASERIYGHRNLALAHFMKSFGNIHHDVDQVLEIYFHQCAIEMTSSQLATAFLYLANNGINPQDGVQILDSSRAKRLKALMLTTGLYNESSEFAFRVGMPGKSGVGGGIAALIPDLLSMVVWSPPLNSMGNSVVGFEALERFTTYLGKSVF
jgi:glutaminase